MLKAPLPPVLSPDLLALDLSSRIGRPELPGSAQPAPSVGPLLADNIVFREMPRQSPPPPSQVVLLAETEFPGSDSAMLKAPLPPVLSPDLLALDLSSRVGRPELPGSAQPAPSVGPLLADNIPPAPSPLPPPAALPSLASEKISPERTVASASPPQAAEPAASPAPSASSSEAPPAQYLAVVTPEISAAEKYLSDISASDAVLATNAASLHRVNCYLKWFNSALEPVETYLSSSPGLAKAQKAELQGATSSVETELSALLDQRKSLVKERELLLADRGQLRTRIEGEPLRSSTVKLDGLLGRPIEVSSRFALQTHSPLPSGL